MRSRRSQLKARVPFGVVPTAAFVLFLAAVEERRPSCVDPNSEKLVLLFWSLGPLSVVAGASVVLLGSRERWHPAAVAFTTLAVAALWTVLALAASRVSPGCLG